MLLPLDLIIMKQYTVNSAMYLGICGHRMLSFTVINRYISDYRDNSGQLPSDSDI